MEAWIGFLPFAAFALVEKSLGVVAGLAAATLLSLALVVRDRLRGAREFNLLEAGSALLFGVLTALALVKDGATWSVWWVRSWVDGGLTVVVVLGIAVRRPFTLQLARRQASVATACSVGFLRTNQVIAGAWALALATLTAIDLAMVSWPGAPASLGVGLTLAALAGAVVFTRRYAAGARARAIPADRVLTPSPET